MYKYFCPDTQGQVVNIQNNDGFIGIYVLFPSVVESCSYPNSKSAGAGLYIGIENLVAEETVIEVKTQTANCKCVVYKKEGRKSVEYWV